MTRLVTIDYSEYQKLLNTKEYYEKNMEVLEGKIIVTHERYKELEDLQQRIDKVIEYIHNHQPVFKLFSKEQIQEWFEKEYYVELLEILRGNDENSN